MKRLEDVSLGRANNIDFLRFLLASLVVFSHSYPLIGRGADEPFDVFTSGQRTGGALAVDGFFILSGFLITRSWVASRGLGDYMVRRALRIYPGFIAAVFFCGLVVAPRFARDVEVYWRDFSWIRLALSSLNLSMYLPPVGDETGPGPLYSFINGSLWTIRYEFMCYLAVAALGLAGALRRKWPVAVALAACLAAYSAQLHFQWRVPGGRLGWLICDPYHWPRLMGAFLGGAVAYLYRDRIVLSGWGFLAATVGLGLAATVRPSLQLLPLAEPLLGTYALLCAAYAPGGRLQHFASHGDFSYGIYLYSFPIQKLLVLGMGERLGPLTLFATSMAASCAAGALSWHLVEKPFMRLKRSSRAPGTRPETAGEPVASAAASPPVPDLPTGAS